MALRQPDLRVGDAGVHRRRQENGRLEGGVCEQVPAVLIALPGVEMDASPVDPGVALAFRDAGLVQPALMPNPGAGGNVVAGNDKGPRTLAGRRE